MMTRHMRLMAMVVGVSAMAAACGGGTSSSVLGPTGLVSGTARGADDGATGGGTGGATGGGGELRLQCEQRSGRSKVSVDGRNLAVGTYQARIASGANSATAAAKASIGDEVEFDFDSNSNDVAAGATRIAASFIQNGRVQGDILDASGAVVASASATCSVR